MCISSIILILHFYIFKLEIKHIKFIFCNTYKMHNSYFVFLEILYFWDFVYREHACALFKNNTVLVSRPPWSTAEDLWHQGCWDEATRTPGLWRSAPKPNLRRGFGAEVLSCAGLSAPPRRKPGAQALYINKKGSKTKSFKMKHKFSKKKTNTFEQNKNKLFYDVVCISSKIHILVFLYF